MRARRKKIIAFGIAAVALVAGLIAIAPLWFPWVLAPALRHFGIQYAQIERAGYARFALVEAAFTKDSTTLSARRIEMFSPTVWLWHRQLQHTNHLFLQITDWRFEKRTGAGGGGEKTPAQSGSLCALLDQLKAKLPTLRTWLPRALLTNGMVRAGKNEFEFPRVEWQNGRLHAEASHRGFAQRARIDGNFASSSSWPWRLRVEPLDLEATASFGKARDQVTISGTALWRTNKLAWESHFPAQGWLPNDAALSSESFRVPAADLQLTGYSDLSGSLSGQWHQGQLKIAIQVRAEPTVQKSPRIAVDLRAHGTTNSLTIEQLQVATPFLRANLSPGTQLRTDGQLISPSATMHFEADLDQQPWIAAAGQLRGTMELQPSKRKYPSALLQIAGTNLAGFGMRVREFNCGASLSWPQLEVRELALRIPDNATIQGHLSADLISRVISDGKLQLTGSGKLELLPADYTFDQLSAYAEFQGRLDDLIHSARIDVQNFRAPKIEPWNGSFASHGEKLDFDLLNVQLNANTSSLKASGSASIKTNGLTLRVGTLTLAREQQQLLALAAPADLAIERLLPSGDPPTPRWSFHCRELNWRGGERTLKLTGSTLWPSQGVLSASARALSADVFQGFVTARLPDVTVNQLDFGAAWTNGPATFQLVLNSKLALTNALPLAVEAKATGITNAIILDRLAVSDGTNAIVTGTGSLPVTLNPAHPGHVIEANTRQPIEFLASTQPNQSFWGQVSQWTRLTLRQPSINLAVSGTLESPRGHIALKVDSLELPFRVQNRQLPRLDKLTANLEMVPGRLRLQDFHVLVQDQPVQVTGEVPFSGDLSARLKQVVDLKNATARIQIDRAGLAPFALFFPKIVSPQGQLSVDLAVRPGLNLDGVLWVTNVATRPGMPLGSVQDISARLKFSGQTIQLENFTGFLGGAPLVVSGAVNLANRDPKTDLPQFDFKIRGDNIPLARQPELILRSDLDLTISNTTNNLPVASGRVRLHDSFYLADLKLLIPGRVTSPSRRPPYFSLETEPLAEWRLAVRVEGDRFLKVRTPFFRGAISANLNLEGTLREPAAPGTVRINEGVIQFPFANLRVDQGLITLSSDNPYRLQLLVNASTRTFGYDIKMEITGSADEPMVQFSSAPALSSEQIVLLLTTGQVPGNQITFSNQQRAGRMALFVGKGLISKLSGGESDADRLTIRSGENITENGKQTYYIEYKLTEDWSLVGEYDRFSAFNAGLKWRFFSK